MPGIGGLNPRKMEKMMQQLGMHVEQIDASEVIIKKNDGSEIRIKNPEVSKMAIQGKEMYQVAGGEASEGASEPEIDEDDVETVVSQAGVSPDAAKKALEEAQGDIAKAILDLQEE